MSKKNILLKQNTYAEGYVDKIIIGNDKVK